MRNVANSDSRFTNHTEDDTSTTINRLVGAARLPNHSFRPYAGPVQGRGLSCSTYAFATPADPYGVQSRTR
jgi:hypothetical protein